MSRILHPGLTHLMIESNQKETLSEATLSRPLVTRGVSSVRACEAPNGLGYHACTVMARYRNRSGARTNGHRHQFVPNSEDEAEDTEDTSDENYDESDEEEDEMKDECSSISTDDEDESTDEDSSEIEMNYRPKRRSARQASRSTRDPDAAPSRFSTRASRRQVVSYNEDILVDQQRPVCNALPVAPLTQQ